MVRIVLSSWLLAGMAFVTAEAAPAPSDKVLSTRDFGEIRREAETLRGKKFLRSVPVYRISEKELRAVSDRELDKDFPGPKLHAYEELLAWMDMVPPGTDLKSAEANFMADEVIGLYDSDTKEMCVPSSSVGTTNIGPKAAEKLGGISGKLDDIVLAHEFTHALEDQYWPLDPPEDHDDKASTDRGTAHDFLLEGSATRAMIEAIPAQGSGGSPNTYFFLWNLLHSGFGEWALNYELGGVWKSANALAAGVPETLSRSDTMPYSFGYTFCARVMRQWGLDGLDYIYDHPPISSSQIMHPKRCWEWRQFPVRIDLPETLPGGWKQISSDSVGEAGVAVLFGCQFQNLNYGMQLGRGWDGDHVALFQDDGGHRLLLWASSWDSTNAAGRYVWTWMKERESVHHAVVTRKDGGRTEWRSPDGRTGLIEREGQRVVLVETDDREFLSQAEACIRTVAFAESPEKATRAAANPPLRRFNPFWSRQEDGDYVVTRSLGGLLSRHDRNSVGAADRLLLGLAGESRRTTSFHKWELGGGLLVRHESEARRGTAKTTLLPWGVLASRSAARLPQSPDRTITRSSVVWGLAASATQDAAGGHAVRVLPFGILFRRTTGPGRSSTHIVGTGFFHRDASEHSASTERFRLLGIPVWTTHKSAARHK